MQINVCFSKAPIEAIIIVYAEDLIIFTTYQEDYQYITDGLSKLFKMKYLSLLHCCLGIEFMQNRGIV